jgi:hypothetical protein
MKKVQASCCCDSGNCKFDSLILFRHCRAGMGIQIAFEHHIRNSFIFIHSMYFEFCAFEFQEEIRGFQISLSNF